MAEERAEVAQHRRASIAVGEDPAQIVRARKHQVLRGERLGRVAEERVGVLAEEGVEIEARAHGGEPTGGFCRSSSQGLAAGAPLPSVAVEGPRGVHGRPLRAGGAPGRVGRPRRCSPPAMPIRSGGGTRGRRGPTRERRPMDVLEAHAQPASAAGVPGCCLSARLVVIAAVLVLTRNSAAPGHSGSSPAAGASHSASDTTAASTAFTLRSTTPAAGAQDGAPDSTISVTFSAPVSVHTATPVSRRRGGQVGPDERHHPHLRAGLPPHPLLAGGADHSGRIARPAGERRRRPADVELRGLRRGPRGRLRCNSSWPSWTSSRWPSSRPAPHHLGPPGRGPARHLLMALARTPGRTHLAVDPGDRERDHQGGGGGVREPERPRCRRHRRTGGLDFADQRHDQRQGRRHPVRVRTRDQGDPAELDPVERRGGAIHRDPGQHRCSGSRHDRRDLRRLRARALLGHEGDQPRRHHLQRPQRPLRQLLQRWRRAARVHAAPATGLRRATAASR